MSGCLIKTFFQIRNTHESIVIVIVVVIRVRSRYIIEIVHKEIVKQTNAKGD